MSEDSGIVCIYTMPQEMPCSPASSCCGPIGQTEEEIEGLRRELERAVPGLRARVINVRQKLNFTQDMAALKVIRAFGAAALPVLTVSGEVVSIGPPRVPEVISRLRAKLSPARAPHGH